MADKKVADLSQIDGVVSGDWFLVGDTSASDNAKKASPAQVQAGLSLDNVTNDAQLKRAANDFFSFTAKSANLAAADLVLIEDSAASYAKKKVTIGTLGAYPPRVYSTTTASSLTPNIDYYDFFWHYAQNGAITINAATGTHVIGRKITINIYASGTSSTVSWTGASYRSSSNITLATNIPSGDTMMYEFVYDSIWTAWLVIGGGVYT